MLYDPLQIRPVVFYLDSSPPPLLPLYWFLIWLNSSCLGPSWSLGEIKSVDIINLTFSRHKLNSTIILHPRCLSDLIRDRHTHRAKYVHACALNLIRKMSRKKKRERELTSLLSSPEMELRKSFSHFSCLVLCLFGLTFTAGKYESTTNKLGV